MEIAELLDAAKNAQTQDQFDAAIALQFDN
jgi:hypothetical protein